MSRDEIVEKVWDGRVVSDVGARQPDQVGAEGGRRRRPRAAVHPHPARPGLSLRRGGAGERGAAGRAAAEPMASAGSRDRERCRRGCAPLDRRAAVPSARGGRPLRGDRRRAARRAHHRARAPALAFRDRAGSSFRSARRDADIGASRTHARRAVLRRGHASRSRAAARRRRGARGRPRRRRRVGGSSSPGSPTCTRSAPRSAPASSRRSSSAFRSTRRASRARRERGPRRLVRVSPRPAAHVPLPSRRQRGGRRSSRARSRLRPAFARAHAGYPSSTSRTRSCATPTTWPRAVTRPAGRRAGRRARSDRPVRELDHGPEHWLEGDLDGSLPWLERATTISPSYAQGIYARAWTEALAGKALDGRRMSTSRCALSPLDPLHYAMLARARSRTSSCGEEREAARLGRTGGAGAGRARPDRR